MRSVLMSFALLARCLLVTVVPVTAISGVPEQVALNYGSDPSEMVVMWAVFGGTTNDGVAYYGTSPSSLTKVATATTTSYTSSNYSSPVFYKAVMTGLKEGNNVYYYKVGSSSAGYSSVYSFKSHPGVSTAAVTFHIMGDPGQTENSRTTLDDILIAEHSLAGHSGGIINMGDLSYANGKQPKW
jgi:hypothetical protein